MSKYRPIQCKLWNDPVFILLSCDAKFIYLHALTNPYSNGIGLYQCAQDALAQNLKLPKQRYLQGFAELEDAHLIHYDAHFQVVYLPDNFKFNKPDNPNVLKSLLNGLDDIPESPLKQQFLEDVSALAQHWGGNYHKVVDTLTGTFRDTLGVTYGVYRNIDRNGNLNRNIPFPHLDDTECAHVQGVAEKSAQEECATSREVIPLLAQQERLESPSKQTAPLVLKKAQVGDEKASSFMLDVSQQLKKPAATLPSNPQERNKHSSAKLAKETIRQRFDDFWQAYPLKKDKKRALKVFAKLTPDDALLADMLQALRMEKRAKTLQSQQHGWSPQWKHPATWLNGECWQDEHDLTSDPGEVIKRFVAKKVAEDYSHAATST